ncbi:hypothetical protein BD560DRAFT_410515 [Blakeslea trispora]|nr:hypothetical protein BD560DRAFT_410515 [Blakeslea trispora]
MHPSVFYIVFHQISFLISGICITLGVQWLFYRGAATSMSFIPQLLSYTGMLLVGLFIPVLSKRRHDMMQLKVDSRNSETTLESLRVKTDDSIPVFHEGPIHHWSIINLSVLDIVSSFGSMIGFSIIGSGMYQVIHSSVVIWCAILTWICMKKSLSRLQWVAIFATSFGLGLSSIDNFSAENVLDKDPSSISALGQGTLITLASTFMSACIYVYSDTVISKQKVQPLPARVCYWIGFYTSIFSWIWMAVYTLPRFDVIIQLDTTTNNTQVMAIYMLVIFSNAFHAWSYYELIESTGNVATGVLQGIRAIVVYGLSHVLYCKEDHAQCKWKKLKVQFRL